MEIRNFCILAHVDHGKSTLADRFLELTGTIEPRKMREQYLDMHPLEREKGITIKMQPVRMIWHPPNHPQNQNGNIKMQNDNAKCKNNPAERDTKIFNFDFCILNLIDTPGHADFSYEVSRALAAVEGAILLVDATQGIQAQTIANRALAEKENLVIIPAVNKIDLPSAEVERTEAELRVLLGLSEDEKVWKISGKTGEGVGDLLRAVVEKVPPPRAQRFDASTFRSVEYLRALIFDSKYDPYMGVVAHVRIVDGVLVRGEKILLYASGATNEALEVGVFVPERMPVEKLSAGEIGYVATGIKEPALVKVGDTITHADRIDKTDRVNRTDLVLPGYREAAPMVFASIFPESQDEYDALRDALERLQLEDSALRFEPEEASFLGRGMRAGFLGVLHMEIVAERLRREFGLQLVFSTPSVAFRVGLRSAVGREARAMTVYSAAQLPSLHKVVSFEEPWAALEIITPGRFVGVLTTLLNDYEGNIVETETLAGERLIVRVEAPLREVIVDFYDGLKSASQGFASMSYTLLEYRPADLVRLDILVAGEPVLAFSEIVPRKKVYHIARSRLLKLKDALPRELFAVALQGEAEGKIIARETIPAMRKDVTGYLYGGDRTRKMKLWKKQQKGKKKLKAMGRVEISPEVFLKMLQR